MQSRHVRAVYRWTGGEDTTLTFDLALEGDRVIAKALFFGHAGRLNASFYPFVLHADGRIDYGSDYEEDVRTVATDIRERPVRLGELMTTQERDDDGQLKPWVYRCIRLDAV